MSDKHNIDVEADQVVKCCKQTRHFLGNHNPAFSVSPIFNGCFLMLGKQSFNDESFRPIDRINNDRLIAQLLGLTQCRSQSIGRINLHAINIEMRRSTFHIQKQRFREVSRECGFAYALHAIKHNTLRPFLFSCYYFHFIFYCWQYIRQLLMPPTNVRKFHRSDPCPSSFLACREDQSMPGARSRPLLAWIRTGAS